jgi:hypothetical protein
VVLEAQTIAKNGLLKRWFLLALLLSTWLPIAFFVLVLPFSHVGTGLTGIKTIFLFLGTAHVPATLLFYTDKEFSAIIESHRLRYIYIPIILTLTTGVVFAFLSTTLQAFVLLAYWSWQAFHYGRQNVGIYAFASIAETKTGPRRMEKIAIEAGTLLAILGTFKILGTAVAPAYLHRTFDYLYQFGLVTFVALLVFSVVVYAKFYKEMTLLKTIFFFTAVCFFLPVFISTNNNIAFLSYAMAHGMQYIVFMAVISATAPEDGRRWIPYKSLAKFLVLLLVLGFAFWRVGDLKQMEIIKGAWSYSTAADFLFGAVLGATMSHFIIDANAWKLSRKTQRVYMTKRFSFVFNERFSSPS